MTHPTPSLIGKIVRRHRARLVVLATLIVTGGVTVAIARAGDGAGSWSRARSADRSVGVGFGLDNASDPLCLDEHKGPPSYVWTAEGRSRRPIAPGTRSPAPRSCPTL